MLKNVLLLLFICILIKFGVIKFVNVMVLVCVLICLNMLLLMLKYMLDKNLLLVNNLFVW